MGWELEFLVRSALIGIGGTVVMDLWSTLLRRAFGVRDLDYGLVGRWLGHLPRGRLVHDSIANAAPVRRERQIGWCAHYAIGIAFAAVFVAAWGLEWAREPTLLPALAFGVLTLVAPFAILQPGMGAGFAGGRLPNPGAARIKSLMAHLAFGTGLYVAAAASARLIP